MPFYDYKCNNCNNQTEEFHSINDQGIIVCEVCGYNMEKAFSSENLSINFKGKGFYKTDYC